MSSFNDILQVNRSSGRSRMGKNQLERILEIDRSIKDREGICKEDMVEGCYLIVILKKTVF
jgi:hypothetical protein